MKKSTSSHKKKKINYELGENIHDDVNTNQIHWFPGHMNKAIKEIKTRLKKVDLVLEIRDARSPFVTGNPAIHQAIGEKGRLIILNKAHLADPEVLKLWQEWFLKQSIPFIFLHNLNRPTIKNIIKRCKEQIHKRRLQSNPEGGLKTKINMMILGLPNTGKSTLINKLADRNATKAANTPGLTRHQIWIKIDADLSLLDTPGIMPPKIKKEEHGIWLAALGAIPDRIIGAEVPACFIIKHLLVQKSNLFKERFKLKSFTLTLPQALENIAISRGCIQQKGEYDYDRVYQIILGDFRDGKLGPISFGLPPK